MRETQGKRQTDSQPKLNTNRSKRLEQTDPSIAGAAHFPCLKPSGPVLLRLLYM